MNTKKAYKLSQEINERLLTLERMKLGVDETYCIKDLRSALDNLTWHVEPFKKKLERKL
jgi:hypothetical protein